MEGCVLGTGRREGGGVQERQVLFWRVSELRDNKIFFGVEGVVKRIFRDLTILKSGTELYQGLGS